MTVNSVSPASSADRAGRDSGSAATLSLLRFSLAMMVMATHLSGPLPVQLGRAAVEAFFCISGFLITMVASGRYASRPFAFLANRFLRIYPTYWICLLIGFVIVARIPNGAYLHPSLYLPQKWDDLAANVAVFGLTQQTASRVLPAAWSLDTELWFYLVIGLVTASRVRLTILLLALSTLVSAAAAMGLIAVTFYGTPLGNAYAFFIGSAVWHHRQVLHGWLAPYGFCIGLALFEWLAWQPAAGSPAANVFFAAPAAGLLLWGLWNCRADALLGPVRGFCAFLGKLAYPVFLLHWPIGLLTYHLFGVWHSWGMFAISAVGSIAAGALINLVLDTSVEKWRSRIRRGAVLSATKPAGQEALPPVATTAASHSKATALLRA